MADAAKQPTRFGPVVLAGVGSAAVLAVVGARDWFRLSKHAADASFVPSDELRADMPLALALALVLLAAWGVVLVTGRRARRLMLLLAALATVGLLACLVVAPFTLPDEIRSGIGSGGGAAKPTAAYLIACVVAPLALAVAALGWRFAPRWPEMSSRYDAPSKAQREEVGADELGDLELWKALDEGHDPTGP